jgi:hypothetical protein
MRRQTRLGINSQYVNVCGSGSDADPARGRHTTLSLAAKSKGTEAEGHTGGGRQKHQPHTDGGRANRKLGKPVPDDAGPLLHTDL